MKRKSKIIRADRHFQVRIIIFSNSSNACSISYQFLSEFGFLSTVFIWELIKSRISCPKNIILATIYGRILLTLTTKNPGIKLYNLSNNLNKDNIKTNFQQQLFHKLQTDLKNKLVSYNSIEQSI